MSRPGGLYLEGRFNGGFFALRVWGASIYIHTLLLPPQRGFSEFGGAYTWRGLFPEFYSSLTVSCNDSIGLES